MGVAGEIGEHGLGPGEGRLGVDHPVELAQGREPSVEGCWLGERVMLAEEREAAGRVGRLQHLEEAAPEEPREHAHGQEEAGPAGDPFSAVG